MSRFSPNPANLGFAGETDIASASTCDIGASATEKVRITGTTTITSLGAVANVLRFVRFAGVLTLTYNATSLVLPGAANIVTAAGDIALAVSDGTGNWRVLYYTRAAASPDFQPYDGQLSSLVRQNAQSVAYTLVLTDGGKHILHPSSDTTARTVTIPANASVAFPVGTAVTFVNQSGAGSLTIAITSDTKRLAGAGTTGSRTLAANGVATALKIASTEWIISGAGLT